METQIQEFIDILQDNAVIIKRYELEKISADDPRIEDGKFEFNEDLLISEDELYDDELLEYLEFELTNRNVATSVLLNGFTRTTTLEVYLEDEYEKFRIALSKDFNALNKNDIKEIIQQVKYARNGLKEILMFNRDNNYHLFDSLISKKIEFCVETIRYINMSLVGLPTEATFDREYYFSNQPKFSKIRHYILYDIHKNLKVEGYIDCTPDAFKNVFTSKEPKPIKWFKPQRHLTYLIKILTEQFLIKKNKPSNFYIAEKYFHIYRNGELVHPKKQRHDDDPKQDDKEFLDKVIDDAISAYK